MRRHVSYANVAATLALLFAMSGGALAANHYLVSSTKQISPKVLKKLKGNRGPRGATGATGATGTTGTTGKEGPQGKEGKTGKEGPEGLPGEPATRLLAAIQANGTVTRSQGLEGVQHVGTGDYVLTWDENVSQCYPIGNIFATTGYVVMDGFATNTLTVLTFNAANAATDEAFYVAVLC
jgi:hypothetical protein